MPDNDNYSDKETAARAEATLQRMLNTPPKPHKALGKSKQKNG